MRGAASGGGESAFVLLLKEESKNVESMFILYHTFVKIARFSTCGVRGKKL